MSDEINKDAKKAIEVEEAVLEVQAYENIVIELKNLALLHEKDKTGADFEKSVLQHEAIVEDRKVRLDCRKNGHALGEVIRDSLNSYTICPACQEKVELIQKTIFDVENK